MFRCPTVGRHTLAEFSQRFSFIIHDEKGEHSTHWEGLGSLSSYRFVIPHSKFWNGVIVIISVWFILATSLKIKNLSHKHSIWTVSFSVLIWCGVYEQFLIYVTSCAFRSYSCIILQRPTFCIQIMRSLRTDIVTDSNMNVQCR